MKKMLLLLTVTALSFTAAQAQDQLAPNARKEARGGQGKHADRTPEQRADMQTQRLTKQLGLSADQQPKVRAIFLAQATEMQSLRGQMTPGSTDRQAMGQQMKAVMTRTDEQLKTALTAEQYTKYAAQRDERMDRMEDRKAEVKAEKKTMKSKTKIKAS
ncbi:hypothetical protein [Hymenobacter koreensis]|uniref:DUF4890 domain-containing protein n=1 Tax=Hymenobacter koreensis TaxID=1084523 RepID=A0ABP8IVR8_9BACT